MTSTQADVLSHLLRLAGATPATVDGARRAYGACWLIGQVVAGIEEREHVERLAELDTREPSASPANERLDAWQRKQRKRVASTLWLLKQGGRITPRRVAIIREAGRTDDAIAILKQQYRADQWPEEPGRSSAWQR